MNDQLQQNSDEINKIIFPSSSPRYMKADKLDIVDIKGAQSSTNKVQKLYSIRDHINVNDINDEARIYKA